MSKAVAAPRLLAPREDSPDELWEWYQFQRQLLAEEENRAKAAITDPVSTGGALGRYIGKSMTDLGLLFVSHRTELDFLAMLGLLAATEARLQRDLSRRIDGRLKDPVSRAFRNARRSIPSRRIDLEQILDIWRDLGAQPNAKNAVSQFKAALPLRHWLAHGRYWVARLGRDFCANLIHALGI